MKKLSPNGVKLLKTLHIFFAMLWLSGAIAMILIHFLVPNLSDNGLQTKLLSLVIIDDWMIIVSAITTFFLALIYGFFTNWGFFKHRWITVKWIITVGVILYGTFAYHPWLMHNLNMAGRMGMDALHDTDFLANQQAMMISGFVQAGLLIFAVIISVYKPWRKKRDAQPTKA